MARLHIGPPLRGQAKPQGVLIVSHTAMALLVSLTLTALAAGVRLLYGPHLRDDAYITLRYAVNLASGHGFVYNPGETVLGTSTPLYALIVAALAKLGLEATTASVVLGVLPDAVAVSLLFLLVWQRSRWYAALATALGYSLYLPLVSHAVSGMETPLYSLLLVTACLAYSRERLSIAGLLAALAALLRPEGVILAVALAAHHLWRRRPVTPWPIVSFLAIFLPWTLFSTFYFGSPLPNSVLAKLDLGIGDPFLSAKQLTWYFGATGERWLLPATLLTFLGVRRCWKAGKGQQALLVWAAVYALAFTAANRFVYPLWPFEWYFVPLLVPVALSAGYGLEELLSWVKGRSPRLWLSLPALALVTFGAFYGLVAYRGYYTLHMFVEGREGLYKEIAGRLAQYGIREVVAAPEIGTLGFYYQGPILDLHGLVSPQVLGLRYQDIVEGYRPPWLVSWNTLVPEELLAEPWFDAEYRPVLVRQNWEGRQAILFRRYPTTPLEEGRGVLLGDTLRLEGMVAQSSTDSDGSLVRLRLDWHVLRPITDRYTFFVHLLDSSGNLLAQQDNEPQEGTRLTNSLLPGHLVDLYDLRVPGWVDLAGAQVAIGAYLTDDRSQHLSWSSRGGTHLGQEVLLPLVPLREGDIRLAEAFRECKAEFGGSIALLGYSLVRSTEGGWNLSLLWKSIKILDVDYTVFVHAMDRRGRIVGQMDSQPGSGRYPTSLWLRNEVVLDQRELPPLSEETATFRLGLYSLPAEERLPLQGPAVGDSVIIDPAVPGCQPFPPGGG